MLKKVLRILGALVAVLLLAAAAAFAVGNARLHGSMDTAIGHDLVVPTDSAAIATGKRFVTAYGCADCHGDDLGGAVVIDEPEFMVLSGPNLTPGEGGRSQYTPADWERAIRHGIAADGRTLLIMPSGSYAKLSDQDVGELVAFLLTLDPIDRTVPPPAFGPVSRIAVLMGGGELIPATVLDHEASHVAAVLRGPTPDYGAYLSNGCKDCHGDDFSGAPASMGLPVASANLTPDPGTGLGNWTFEDFDRAVRSGRRPDGTGLDGSMPWISLSTMTYDEVLAMWRYLETIPAVVADRRAP